MNSLLKQLDETQRSALREMPHPDWIPPMLATLADEPFAREGWMFERKLDGERMLTFRCGGEIRLRSRNRKPHNATYPELVEAAAALEQDNFVLDGEIVAFRGNRTSFERLQRRMQIQREEEARASRVKVYYYVFDLPCWDGYDLRRLPLRVRKRLLKKALAWDDPIRFLPHWNTDGKKRHREACRRGWEGIIAKDGNSRYESRRSRKWLKFKCVRQQEFVIGGYTDPEGARQGFGALLIGYYQDEALRYAGAVGTGYDDAFLENFSARLRKHTRKGCPFARQDRGGLPRQGAHWVAPRFVGQVGFTEWTRDGKLRHPRFLGLRDDKAPREVVRERPKD